jgi:hypothetical protein
MGRYASFVATLIVALAATTWASAAIRRDPGFNAPPPDPDFAAASSDAGQIDLESVFFLHGIDPNSNKARIIVSWVEKIRRDPIIAARIPGGSRRIEQIFLDSSAREDFMSEGLARLTPSDRLQYLQLLTRFFDEVIPVNCFGLSSMSAVMNRVSVLDMAEPDVEQYFGLLYRVLTGNASNRPLPAPTSEQNAAAEHQFSRAVVTELGGDRTDIERFVFYASNPSKATPSDLCWATRVTLHAIIAMPEPERAIVLLRTTAPDDRRDVPSARQSGAPDTARSLPASSPPGGADAR